MIRLGLLMRARQIRTTRQTSAKSSVQKDFIRKEREREKKNDGFWLKLEYNRIWTRFLPKAVYKTLQDNVKP